MHRALLTLFRLQVRAWVRRQFTGGSTRRAVLGALGLVMFLVWLVAVGLSSALQPHLDPADAFSRLSVYLTVFAVLPLVFGNEDRAIAFSPAEIDFLFPGPFARRDLVLFKLMKLVCSSAAGGLIFALILGRYGAFPTRAVGAILALVFINLLSTVVALVRDTIQERSVTLARRLLLLGVVIGIGAVIWVVRRSSAPTAEELGHIVKTPVAHVVLAPARLFAHVMVADSVPELLGWSAACVSLIGGALLAVLAMDKGYMEAALAASQRRQTRMARMGRGIATAPGKALKTPSLPGLSALGPGGAIVRRQFIVALRTSRAWAVVFLLAVGYGYVMSRVGASVSGQNSKAPPLVALMPGLIILLTMLPQMLRFDFRAELDHMDGLKALPIAPAAVACAELAVPTIILSLQGMVVAGAVSAFAGLEPATLVMAALAVVPVGAMVIGLENLVFLMLPTRSFVPGQASMVFGGRRVLMLLARLGLIAVAGGAVSAAGAAAWALGHSVTITYAACWLALWVIVAAIVRVVAWAFARFDVSTDMPA